MLQPFLTEAPNEIFRQIGIQDGSLKAWDSIRDDGVLKEGEPVQKGNPIFPRLDVDKEVQAIKAMMQKPKQKEEQEPQEPVPEQKEEVVIDDFMKLDMRVAEVMKAESVKKPINC